MVATPQPSKPGLSIVRASPEHVPAIKTMVDAAYTKYIERIGKPPGPMLADYDKIIQTHEVFMLQDEGLAIVGSIVLDVNHNANFVQIDNLVVHPTAQGRGFGRVLLSCAEDVANSEGYSVLIVYTNVKMYENLGMYVKMGFVETDRRTEDGYERVYFRKSLT